MAHDWLRRLDFNYQQQWSITFGIGFFTWFAIICFARILPPPLQLLTMLIPIACFAYALWILPSWQDEGHRKSFVRSLHEREFIHGMRQQHELRLRSLDLEHAAQSDALDEVYAVDSASTPPEQLAPPAQENTLLKIQQEVFQTCGDIGWSFIEYASGRGAGSADREGWFSIEKLRSNWGRNLGLNTEQMRQLLVALTQIQAGEWRDSTLSEWRLLLTFESP